MDVFLDILITSSIVYYLRLAKSDSPFTKTNTLIDKIIRSSMENNAASGVTATVRFCSGVVHIMINWLVPKFYILSFIITLNSRASQREGSVARNTSARRDLPILKMSFRFTVTQTQAIKIEACDEFEEEFMSRGQVPQYTSTQKKPQFTIQKLENSCMPGKERIMSDAERTPSV